MSVDSSASTRTILFRDVGAYEAGATGSLIVNTTQDVVSASDPLNSLREALTYAGTLSGPQTITFQIPPSDPGYDSSTSIYMVKLATDGDDIFGPSALAIASSVTIDGATNKITIARDTDAQPSRLRLFYVETDGRALL